MCISCMSMIEGRLDRTVVILFFSSCFVWSRRAFQSTGLSVYFPQHFMIILTLLSYSSVHVGHWTLRPSNAGAYVDAFNVCVYSMQIARRFILWGF